MSNLPKPYYETELGNLYHGDCLEIMPHLEPVDLVLTDPPYSKKTHNGQRTSCGSQKVGVYRPDIIKATINFDGFDYQKLKKYFSTLKVNRWVMSNIDWRYCHLFESDPPNNLEFIRHGIWIKPRYTPQFSGDRPSTGWESIIFMHPKGKKKWNGGGTCSVFIHNTEHGIKHPTAKPISFAIELIDKFSINTNEIILDPFIGSGTTAIACERLNRRWIGIEIEEKYCEISAKRIEKERSQLKLFT